MTTLPKRRLDAERVRAARAAVRDRKASISRLAADAGVAYQTMASAVYGRSWGGVTDPGPLPAPGQGYAHRAPHARLTAGAVRVIRKEIAAGHATYRDLGERYEVSEGAVRAAAHGLTWRHITDPPPVHWPVPDTAPRDDRHTLLNDDLVAQLRREARAGKRMFELAAAHRVHARTIAAAVHGKTWRHITDPPPLPRPRAGKSAAPPYARLTAAKVRRARRDYAAGVSMLTLAKRYGVGESTIFSAVHGQTWEQVTDPPPVPVGLPGWERLTAKDVEQAAAWRAQGATLQTIGARLGVTKGTVSRRLAGRARASARATV